MHKSHGSCFFFPPDDVLVALQLEEVILFNKDRCIREGKTRAELGNISLETDRKQSRKRPGILLELSLLMAGLL